MTANLPNPNPCAACGGELIGSEVAFGTCGHCGGRSKAPDRRRQIAEITMATPPAQPELDEIEAAYLAEGYENVTVVAVPDSFESAHTPWTAKVIAEGNPYQAARS